MPYTPSEVIVLFFTYSVVGWLWETIYCSIKDHLHLLSGGEQTKVKLAILELTPCNFLIMDEPTNHLDDETKEGLKKALQEFPGNLILVSHEESFYTGWLDKVLNVEKLSLKN